MSLFKTGQIIMTEGILTRAGASEDFMQSIMEDLKRYVSGDWGNVPEEEKKANDLAVKLGDDRIMARYNIENEPVWFITEWDGSVTTILLPEEY